MAGSLAKPGHRPAHETPLQCEKESFLGAVEFCPRRLRCEYRRPQPDTGTFNRQHSPCGCATPFQLTRQLSLAPRRAADPLKCNADTVQCMKYARPQRFPNLRRRTAANVFFRSISATLRRLLGLRRVTLFPDSPTVPHRFPVGQHSLAQPICLNGHS